MVDPIRDPHLAAVRSIRHAGEAKITTPGYRGVLELGIALKRARHKRARHMPGWYVWAILCLSVAVCALGGLAGYLVRGWMG